MNQFFISGIAVADLVRTSLGPRGMDKMIIDPKEAVTITNDGATIMQQLELNHPAARMLIDLSKAQDVEAGDGTTSVVVLAGSFLRAAHKLLEKGLHPAKIFDGFGYAWSKANEILHQLAIPVDLADHSILEQNAATSLSSKIVSNYADILAPLAVQAVTSVVDPAIADNVDLRNIRVVCKVGGTIEDTRLVEGLVFPQGALRSGSTGTRVENAKLGIIQFCLSPPKSDIESSIVVSEYEQMDRVLKEERKYIVTLLKQIKKTGCNVLLIQKSILRDAVSDLAFHYLGKMEILAIKDIERNEIDLISRATGALPVASIEGFTSDKLGSAKLVQQVSTPGGKIVEMTGCASRSPIVSVLVRGTNNLVVAEAERSLHDALCVVRSLIKKKSLLIGGGAAEVESARILNNLSREETGVNSLCLRAFADALEVIPVTLAENAGLNAIQTLTELRKAHAEGQKYAGVDVRRGKVSDMRDLEVLQPLLVNTSALSLAVEYVRMILKIDDVVSCR
ncbi:hypothetical protein RCL1_008285 [Eukaryota sp. TZLM3-RCL]